MSRSRDYILDIEGVCDPSGADGPREVEVDLGFRGRKWLAVHWRCCHVYSRIYCDAAGTLYEGACPSCGKRVRARVGKDGTSQRVFQTRI
ncbi:MAG: hypothetical protein ACYTGQ_20235 [Planctomycetota bacterium]